MLTNRTIEQVAKLTDAQGASYFLFPDYTGHMVINAKTIVQASIRGKELPFQKVYLADNRNGDTTYVNMYHILKADFVSVSVPETITALYTAPEGETEAEKEIRLTKIKNYFGY